MKGAPHSRCALYNVFEMPDKYTAGAVAVTAAQLVPRLPSALLALLRLVLLRSMRSNANGRLASRRLAEMPVQWLCSFRINARSASYVCM